MTRKEFIDRTGIEVSDERFEKIHAVYMATDCAKDEFCNHYTQGLEDSPIVAEMVSKFEMYANLYEVAMKKREDLARTIILQLGNYNENTLIEVAENVIGKGAAIKFRIANKIELTDSDLAFIAKSL